jgi:hypothetical protein
MSEKFYGLALAYDVGYQVEDECDQLEGTVTQGQEFVSRLAHFLQKKILFYRSLSLST